MPKKVVRRNEPLLRWFRAGAFAAATGWGMHAMQFRPLGVAYALALGIGALSLMSPGVAVIAGIVALGLPLLAADFLTGVIFLVIGLAAIQYLGQDNGRAFLLIMIALIGTAVGPLWTAALLAGYLLGPSEGAVTALLACLVVQVAGIVTGNDSLGLVVTGGSGPSLVTFSDMPPNLLSFGWVSLAIESIEPQRLLDTLSGIGQIGMLVAQPIVWGAAAAVTGLIRRPLCDPRRVYFGPLAALAGSAAAIVGTAMAFSVAGGGLPNGSELAIAAGASFAIAAAAVLVWDSVFPPLAVSKSSVQSGMSAEDVDVDELLRLIATAEDELANKHTVNTVVMITDMKSFSKMTEEEGSFVSAKTIQRHRDLLLPVIAQFRGHGKSTGGDGLVASFESPADALQAAMVMQRTLDEHNKAHASERDIIIRIGVASGEVVLDKGGRPFIGNALNLAARVMNLGEGGQVFTTRQVTSAAKLDDLVTHSHGDFELRNIAEPVKVLEVLWADGQEPCTPRIHTE